MRATCVAADLLVIDDEPAILEVVRDCLSDEGYQVAVAPSLAAGLDHLTRDYYALILADSFASVPNLWAGLDRLLAAAPNTPIVISSAHPRDLFDGWEGRGFAGFLPKPFDLDDLLAQIRAHLDTA